MKNYNIYNDMIAAMTASLADDKAVLSWDEYQIREMRIKERIIDDLRKLRDLSKEKPW